MMKMEKLKKAALFGLYTVVIGSIVSLLMRGSFKSNLPEVCKSWNKNHVMEICLFFTGAVVFLTFEMTHRSLAKFLPW